MYKIIAVFLAIFSKLDIIVPWFNFFILEISISYSSSPFFFALLLWQPSFCSPWLWNLKISTSNLYKTETVSYPSDSSECASSTPAPLSQQITSFFIFVWKVKFLKQLAHSVVLTFVCETQSLEMEQQFYFSKLCLLSPMLVGHHHGSYS